MPDIHEEYKKSKIYVIRTFVIFGVQVFLLLVLFLRLLFLQTFQFEKYKNKSEENRIQTIPIPPLRGNILDRYGKVMTTNRPSYRVLLYKHKGLDREVLNRLANILKMSEKDRAKMFEKFEKNKYKPVISLVDNLKWDEVAKIEFNYYRLNGVAIESGHIRGYPFRENLSHLVGYVSLPDENELPKSVKKRELYLHPDYRLGKTGIEKYFDEDITGVAGFRNVEVNAFGVPLRELYSQKAKEGKHLQLTIDLDLQMFITEKMKKKRGAVIVMDVKSGEILAMVSAPTFNPNEFVEGISPDYWVDLINDSAKPLNNKAVTAIYPPGSTIKPIVALAGLEKGWGSAREVECLGKTWLNKREFHCWEERGHGSNALVDAMMKSCNIYFARLSLFTGIDDISKMAHKFGIGETFDISLPDVKSGLMPDREWKKNRLNDVWVQGDTVNVGVGQGFTLVTPLQLAVMTARIANGGYPVYPFLIYDSKWRGQNEVLFDKEPMVKKEYLDAVKQGMYNVVNNRKGTAYFARIKKPKGFEMAGKTGTAQVIAKETKDYMEENNQRLKEELRNHGLFIGFAPYDEPKYAIAVVIEHGEGGAMSAAPVAKDVLQWIAERSQKMEE